MLAVDGVDLAVRQGAVFGLLGPDGAGKSTLIRCSRPCSHPTPATRSCSASRSCTRTARVKPRIGYMSQRFSMYPDLTVAENLEFFARIRGVPASLRRTRAASLLESMGLAQFAGRQAADLSGGMKQKLMLASTLMHEPDLLLLDEPTTGVDPVSRREFWRIIADLQAAGKTVFVATPYMDEAERCTDIAFMDDGRIPHRGTPAEVKARVPGTLFEVSSPRPARSAGGAAPTLGASRRRTSTATSVRVLVGPRRSRRGRAARPRLRRRGSRHARSGRPRRHGGRLRVPRRAGR